MVKWLDRETWKQRTLDGVTVPYDQEEILKNECIVFKFDFVHIVDKETMTASFTDLEQTKRFLQALTKCEPAVLLY